MGGRGVAGVDYGGFREAALRAGETYLDAVIDLKAHEIQKPARPLVGFLRWFSGTRVVEGWLDRLDADHQYFKRQLDKATATVEAAVSVAAETWPSVRPPVACTQEALAGGSSSEVA